MTEVSATARMLIVDLDTGLNNRQVYTIADAARTLDQVERILAEQYLISLRAYPFAEEVPYELCNTLRENQELWAYWQQHPDIPQQDNESLEVQELWAYWQQHMGITWQDTQSSSDIDLNDRVLQWIMDQVARIKSRASQSARLNQRGASSWPNLTGHGGLSTMYVCTSEGAGRRGGAFKDNDWIPSYLSTVTCSAPPHVVKQELERRLGSVHTSNDCDLAWDGLSQHRETTFEVRDGLVKAVWKTGGIVEVEWGCPMANDIAEAVLEVLSELEKRRISRPSTKTGFGITRNIFKPLKLKIALRP